jgi:hypothetical protein
LGLAVAAIAFMFWTARGLLHDWDSARDVAVDWNLAALSLLPALASNAALALAWVVLLRAMVEPKPPVAPMVALYAHSNFGRYLPGKVGMPLMRMTGAAAFGVPSTVTAASVMLELLSWIATACVVSSASLASVGRHDLNTIVGPTASIAAIGIAAATLAGALVDRSWLPNALMSRLGLAGQGPLLPPRLLALHLLTWTLWAMHGWLVARAVGASALDAIASVPFFVLSPVAGFLALLAPAGVGVREAIISVGLAGVVGPKAALTAALLTRAASLIADVGAWLATRHLHQAPTSPLVAPEQL